MLTDLEKQQLKAIAESEGVDADRLLEVAQGLRGEDAGGEDDAPAPAAQGDKGPKLFMYLLPFVKVGEVRAKFLGLDEPFPGDDQVASDWAREHPMASPTDSQPDE